MPAPMRRCGACSRSRQHRPAVPGTKGLVTAGHPLASMNGMRILMSGGTAFDAAMTVAATLNLVEPSSSGLGGNGFMTLYEKKTGKIYSLAAAGQAPMALKPEMMTAATLNSGVKASLTPGLFGGWIMLLDKFGNKSLAEVLAPVIEYAENGHPLDPSIARGIAGRRAEFEKFPSSARIFVPGGKSPAPWQMFKNPDLANTLKKAVEAEQQALKAGKSRSEALQAAYDRFYKGDIAQDMVEVLPRERRPDHHGGPRGLQAEADRAAPLDLPRLRHLHLAVDLARRLRGADAAQHHRGVRSEEARPQQRRHAAPDHRVNQAGQGRHLQVRGGSGVHENSSGGHAVEGLRGQPAQADRHG